MEGNLRNRLMMFIGKFSDKYVTNEKLGKKTSVKDQLHQYSLIKWNNKNDDKIIGRARKLIFVSHNADSGKTMSELLEEYERLNGNIKKTEAKLYNYPNRYIEADEVKLLEKAKDDAIAAFLAKMSKVFDPFAGGGRWEGQRLFYIMPGTAWDEVAATGMAAGGLCAAVL